MATVELTEQTFESTVLGEGIVLVDFWAEWVRTVQGLRADLRRDLQAIPTLMAFRDGIGVFSQAGALPRPALEDLITQVRALDMDAIRAEIAAKDSESAEA
jgi:thioredoxin 1